MSRDLDKERINRLKNYVNQISISTPSLKYELINEIEKGKITDTNEIKKYIEGFEKIRRNKAKYEKIVFDSHLDYTSNRKLKSKINKEEIITEIQLKQEIIEEKKKSDLRRKLIKIVEDSNLDYISRRILIRKINNNEESKKETYNSLDMEIWSIKTQGNYRSKYMHWGPYYNFIDRILEEEIFTEEQLNNVIQSELRRTDYRKIIYENYYLDRTSYVKLYDKINNDEIITKEDLKKEIQIAERKIDYKKICEEHGDGTYIDCTSQKIIAQTPYLSDNKIRHQWPKTNLRIKLIKIVIDSHLNHTSQRKLICKINKEEIITEVQVAKEIIEEIKKSDLRE